MIANWTDPPAHPVRVILYERLVKLLGPLGIQIEDNSDRGDFWVCEDELFPDLQEVEFLNLDLLRPPVITALQALLADHPDWVISVRVEGIDEAGKRRGMGLFIQSDQIIDDLKREYLPIVFRDMTF